MNKQQLIENKVRKIVKRVLIESESDFDIDIIKQLTDVNNHTEAVLELAKQLKNRRAIKALTGVQMIHDTEGHLPSWLGEYRDQWLKSLLQTVKRDHGDDVYKQLYMSF